MLAINSYMNPHNFPATWGKFSMVFLLASCLPPGSEVATQDIAKAYQMVPLHPPNDQQLLYIQALHMAALTHAQPLGLCPPQASMNTLQMLQQR